MADGSITISLNDDIARSLKAAADAAGRSLDDYACELIAAGFLNELRSSLNLAGARRLEGNPPQPLRADVPGCA